MGKKTVGVREFIGQLRTELADAMKDGEGSDLRFGVEGLEVELQVEAVKVGGGEAGFKLYVLSGKAKDELRRKTVQTVRLKLKPKPKDADDLDLADDDD
ncbi:MAG: trypco2 family protein [Acidobacteriota bacterium]